MATRRSHPAEADSRGVDAYIANCPAGTRVHLRALRAAIREAAPGATETMSYFQMPGYLYPGYDYNGMFVWFGLHQSHIGLYLRPPAIREHQEELAGYATTKAVVRLPLDEKIPIPLVKKLVKASIKAMKDRAR